MTFVIATLLVLLVVAILLLRFAGSHRISISSLDELAGQTQTVDLPALQNLTDANETRFLRQNLSPARFRIVQRERNLAAAEYIRHIYHNAAVLIQFGQLGLANPDPQLAEAARVMVERAAHVRLMATLVLMKLYARSVIPAVPFAADDIFRDYRNLTDSALLFTRLQRPAFAGRVGAML